MLTTQCEAKARAAGAHPRRNAEGGRLHGGQPFGADAPRDMKITHDKNNFINHKITSN